MARNQLLRRFGETIDREELAIMPRPGTLTASRHLHVNRAAPLAVVEVQQDDLLPSA